MQAPQMPGRRCLLLLRLIAGSILIHDGASEQPRATVLEAHSLALLSAALFMIGLGTPLVRPGHPFWKQGEQSLQLGYLRVSLEQSQHDSHALIGVRKIPPFGAAKKEHLVLDFLTWNALTFESTSVVEH